MAVKTKAVQRHGFGLGSLVYAGNPLLRRGCVGARGVVVGLGKEGIP